MNNICCRTLADVLNALKDVLEIARRQSQGEEVTFFFRGVERNYENPDSTSPISPAFKPSLERKGLVKYERDLYNDALRYNITNFAEDYTMQERLARMQHYGLPTRFADVTENILLATFFACGGWNFFKEDNRYDGFVRILQVAKHKLKSHTSDIITAIAHLPLTKENQINLANDDLENATGIDYLRYEITNNKPGFNTQVSKEIKQQLMNEVQQVWAFRPILNSPRIRMQSGAFLAFGCGDKKAPLNPTFSDADYTDKMKPSYGIKQVAAFRIEASYKAAIRKELEYCAISHERISPDLSSVCGVLASNYSARIQ